MLKLKNKIKTSPMKIFSFKNGIFSMFFLLAGTVFSQDLGSETVTVVKPYTPSIHDAFKIKEVPSIQDSIGLEKKPVQYSIFSVPVASTFSPAKGRATAVERERPVKIYDNYATLGFGNYTSVLAEFYSNLEVNRTDNFGIFFNHNSSQGALTDVQLNDKYYDSELNLNYTSRNRHMTWNTNVGFEHQLFNWYGVPDERHDEIVDLNLEPQQSYYSVSAGGELKFDESFFDNASAQYRYFGDAYNSAEHRLIFKPTLEIPIGGELFHTNFIVDYVNGSFERGFSSSEAINYSNLNLGVSSSLLVLRDDLSLNLGAAFYYNMDTENSEGSFYVYPQVTASYRMAGEYFTAYAGLEGELKQNSYYNFVQENPFVSPTLGIQPTDQQYNAYVGAKGKLSNAVSYNLRGSLLAENSKALFKANPVETENNNEEYTYGNSFGVVYDAVKTFSFFGELGIDVSRDFNFRVNGEFFGYDTDKAGEAWNLPTYKASVLADYQIGENWYAGANLFFVGERKDLRINSLDVFPQLKTVVTLDAYADLNANLGYRFNDRLSAFVRGNNLLGNNYERWMDYPVLGLQVLAGVTYKFDF